MESMATFMHIGSAMVCLNCDMVFQDTAWSSGDKDIVPDVCPICHSKFAWPLKKWLAPLYSSTMVGGSYGAVSKPHMQVQKRLEILEEISSSDLIDATVDTV